MVTTVQKSILFNKGILFIIIWIARTFIPMLFAVALINSNPFCQYVKLGCVSPTIGFFDIIALIFAIIGGAWIMSGSKWAAWSTAAYVSMIAILDFLGMIVDMSNAAKGVIDLIALVVLLFPVRSK